MVVTFEKLNAIGKRFYSMFKDITIHFNVSIFIIRRQSREKGTQQMNPKQSKKYVSIVDRGRKQNSHVQLATVK